MQKSCLAYAINCNKARKAKQPTNEASAYWPTRSASASAPASDAR